MKTLLTLITLLTLCGCDVPESIVKANQESKKKQIEQTANSFKSPATIGTLPDGRIVKCVTVVQGWDTHYIYFVDNNISINFADGEEGVNTQVIIDGVPYAPVKPDID